MTGIPGFLLKHVSSDVGYVRVDFDCCPADRKAYRCWLKDAFFIFDPLNSWVLREYGGTLNNAAKIHGTLEYGSETLNGFPRIQKRTVSITKEDRDGTRSSNSTTIYENWSRDVVPEAEFQISHYNLPEPNFSGGGRHWSWAFYLVTGVVCLLVAYALWRRKQAAA
jgi:hypothetical protein